MEVFGEVTGAEVTEAEVTEKEVTGVEVTGVEVTGAEVIGVEVTVEVSSEVICVAVVVVIWVLSGLSVVEEHIGISFFSLFGTGWPGYQF